MKSASSQYFRYFTYIRPVTRHPIIRNYGSTIFALLTISILTFFAIKPTVETILVLQKKLENENEILKKVTEKANNLSQGKKNYDNLDQVIKNKINTAIPDIFTVKTITDNLEQIAQAHEASISALQIQPLTVDGKVSDKVGTLAEVSFIFNVEGSYPNFVAILQDLKRSSRLISVDSVSLSKASEGSSLIMSLAGKAYYLK